MANKHTIHTTILSHNFSPCIACMRVTHPSLLRLRLGSKGAGRHKGMRKRAPKLRIPLSLTQTRPGSNPPSGFLVTDLCSTIHNDGLKFNGRRPLEKGITETKLDSVRAIECCVGFCNGVTQGARWTRKIRS